MVEKWFNVNGDYVESGVYHLLSICQAEYSSQHQSATSLVETPLGK
jgi:hypothetical protein